MAPAGGRISAIKSVRSASGAAILCYPTDRKQRTSAWAALGARLLLRQASCQVVQREKLVRTIFRSAIAGLAAIAATAVILAPGVMTGHATAQVMGPIVIQCPSGTEATYFGCQVPPPPGVNYVKNWGVLAVVPATREWVGATGYQGEKKARKALADACRKSGRSCQVYLTFLNQCVAVARVDDAHLAAPGKETVHNGSTAEEARAGAVNKCRSDWGAKSCSPVATHCSINRIER